MISTGWVAIAYTVFTNQLDDFVKNVIRKRVIVLVKPVKQRRVIEYDIENLPGKFGFIIVSLTH